MSKLTISDSRVIKKFNSEHLSMLNDTFSSSLDVPIRVLLGCIHETELFAQVMNSGRCVYYDVDLMLASSPNVILYLPTLSVYQIFDDMSSCMLHLSNNFRRGLSFVTVNDNKIDICCVNDRQLVANLEEILGSIYYMSEYEGIVSLTIKSSISAHQYKLLQCLKWSNIVKPEELQCASDKNINAIKKWIFNNPPLEDEDRGHYYDRYKMSKLDRLTISNFNNLMINCGYELGNEIWVHV